MLPKDPVTLPLVFGVGSTGIVIGLITVFVGIHTEVQIGLWMAAYVIWIVAAVLVDGKYPGLDVLLGSVLSGFCLAATQNMFYDDYWRKNRIRYRDMPMEEDFAAEVFPAALLMGLFFGVIVGGITAVIVRLRRKRESKKAYR